MFCNPSTLVLIEIKPLFTLHLKLLMLSIIIWFKKPSKIISWKVTTPQSPDLNSYFFATVNTNEEIWDLLPKHFHYTKVSMYHQTSLMRVINYWLDPLQMGISHLCPRVLLIQYTQNKMWMSFKLIHELFI